ncbi:hypothetical protein ACVGXO_05070, partial [Enterobacter hormaechei]
ASLRRRDFHRGFLPFFGYQRMFTFKFVGYFYHDFPVFKIISPDGRDIDWGLYKSSGAAVSRGVYI